MGELLQQEVLFPGRSTADQINKIFELLGTPNDTVWPGFAELPAIKGGTLKFMKQDYNYLRARFPPLSTGGRPALSDKGLNLLVHLLAYSPARRISAADALEHAWFEEFPPPKDRVMMPTFPSAHAEAPPLRPSGAPQCGAALHHTLLTHARSPNPCRCGRTRRGS